MSGTELISQGKNQSLTQLLNDREFNGDINRATTQGAKFALLMAMLEPEVVAQPRFENAPPDASLPFCPDELPTHYYASSALKASPEDWSHINKTSEVIHRDGVQNARLWLVMHPEPLSQFNDEKHISDEVLANCRLGTIERIKAGQQSPLKVNETGLYEVLESLN